MADWMKGIGDVTNNTMGDTYDGSGINPKNVLKNNQTTNKMADNFLTKAGDALGGIVNKGIDKYKEAETFDAIKKNMPYIIIAVLAIIGVTYYITKKMK